LPDKINVVDVVDFDDLGVDDADIKRMEDID
jgi:hypothetical protein